jgi:hypothetical protein
MGTCDGNLNSISRPGQLEVTLFERFCMNQRLRAIVNTFGLSSNLQGLLAVFTWRFRRNTEMGTLMGDMHALGGSPEAEDQDNSKTMATLDCHISKLLEAYEEKKLLQEIGAYGDHDNDGSVGMQPEHARLAQYRKNGIRIGVKHDKFGQRGVVFSPFHRNKRNSYVAIGASDDWHAGRIASIFTYTHEGPTSKLKGCTETYFVVHKFRELTETDSIYDPYRKFPIAGRLYYDTIEKDPELVPAKEILCHVAYTPLQSLRIAPLCIHVLPLDQVRRLTVCEKTAAHAHLRLGLNHLMRLGCEGECYGRLAVVSEVDDGGFALNVDNELRGSAVL